MPNQGKKTFSCYTDEGWCRRIGVSVTAVDKPLLSVAQIVDKGGTVVFSKAGSYVDDPSDQQRIHLKHENGLLTMEVWIPRDQQASAAESTAHFQGQAGVGS